MRLIGIIVIVALSAFAARAEDIKQANEYIPPPLDYSNDFSVGPHYRAMVRQAMEKSAQFNFMSFRSQYTMTPSYDPVDAAATDLLNYAYLIQSSTDSAEEKQLLDEYSQILAAHLGNLDAVTQALALGRQDKRFGDPGVLGWLRGGIIRSVVASGDGQSLAGAYDVMTLGEETALLTSLGYKIVESHAVRESTIYYNVYKVIDPRKGQAKNIFVNTTTPMRRLEAQSQKNRFTMDRLRY